jgi:nitrite reductase/ring-hydroxylating ferredoxin subunit
MTNESDDKGISRKGFLTLAWLKRQPPIKERDDLPKTTFKTTVALDELTRLETGTVMKIDNVSGIYAVRILEGIIFVSNICPYDGAAITWNPKDRSEDLLAKTGRFYCQRCSTIYDRTGEVKVGPAESMLNKMSFLPANDQVMITDRVVGESMSETGIFLITE